MDIAWNRCERGSWCNLAELDLAKINVTGVYMIWNKGPVSKVIRVGQGNVAERLQEQRTNPKITSHGALYVTWAEAPSFALVGIERYLAHTWHPVVKGSVPDAFPIKVNSPFHVSL